MEKELDIDKKTLPLYRTFGSWLLMNAIRVTVQGSLIRFELSRSNKRTLALFSSIKFTYYVTSNELVVTLPTTAFLYHLPWSRLCCIRFM